MKKTAAKYHGNSRGLAGADKNNWGLLGSQLIYITPVLSISRSQLNYCFVWGLYLPHPSIVNLTRSPFFCKLFRRTLFNSFTLLKNVMHCHKAFQHVEKLFIQRFLFIHPRFVFIVQGSLLVIQ